jgi:hypothetical protein
MALTIQSVLALTRQDNDIPTAGSSRKGTCFSAELQNGISSQRVRVYGYLLRHTQAPLQLSLPKCVSHVYLKASLMSFNEFVVT